MSHTTFFVLERVTTSISPSNITKQVNEIRVSPLIITIIIWLDNIAIAQASVDFEKSAL